MRAKAGDHATADGQQVPPLGLKPSVGMTPMRERAAALGREDTIEGEGLKCLRENPVAATRLARISHFTRGLRPGLTALPPLRGCLVEMWNACPIHKLPVRHSL